jgi:5-methylcytosine-specific restriction enzyme A
VHHVKPLSTIKEEVEINPETDLVPVCANCHRMIHRRKDDVLTIEELKSIVEQRKIEKIGFRP